jgi:hypothetical protein
MIGGNREVSDARVEQPQYRSDDAANRGDFTTVVVARGWQRIKVPEQLVGAVNQIDFQAKLPDKRTGAGPF